MSCGGTGAARPLDAEEVKMVTDLKAEVEKSAGATFTTFTPHSVKTQVVAGTNYFAKVDVGGEFVHARIYKGPGAAPSVAGVQKGKTAACEIEFFEPTA